MNPGSGFVAGTLVHTEAGLRPIETLRPGDRVLARSASGGAPTVVAVLHTTLRDDEPALSIACRGSDGAESVLTAGLFQPLLTSGQQWLPAAELQGAWGELEAADGSLVRAIAVGVVATATVYDLELGASAGYFVGKAGVGTGDGNSVAGDRPGYQARLHAAAQARSRVASQAETEVRYQDGQPVLRGDAVLMDGGLASGRVSDFLYAGAGVAMITVDEGRSTPRGIHVEGVAQGLQLLERDTPAHADAAVNHLVQRVESGDAAAMYALGVRHIQGAGVPQQDRAGYELLVRAADHDHAEAQYLVGTMTRDPVKAASYRRMAAQQGHARAQFELARCYEEGKGVAQDVREAMRWYGKASDQGNMAARFNLGKLWSFGGDGVDNPNVQSDWFRTRADTGDPVAQWVTGGCHEFGHAGAGRNIGEAVRYYGLSAAQGFGPAICNLACMHERGIGVPQDVERALSLYHQAALLNVAAAMHGLGCMYVEGRGVPPDRAQAIAWFRKAAEAGSAAARAVLKKLPEGDFCKASELLAMAARGGEGVVPRAQMLWEFGNRVDDPDDADTLPLVFGLYLHAAQLGHAQAQFQIASRYLRGLGVAPDSAEAARWYLRAADRGNAAAQVALAGLFESGDGVPLDLDQSRQWYEKAALQGDRHAQFKLGLRASAVPNLAELGITVTPMKAPKRAWRKWW